MTILYVVTPSIDLYPIHLILKVKVIWLRPPENPRRIGKNGIFSGNHHFSRFDPETQPRARWLEAKARLPTPKAQVLGLPARRLLPPARGLLPAADVLEASAHVLAIQADGREERK